MTDARHRHFGASDPFPLAEEGLGLAQINLNGPGQAIETAAEEPGGGDVGPWNFLGPAVSPRRVGIFFAVVTFGLLVIGGRIFQVQVAKGTYYQNQAESNRSRVERQPSQRGIIYDRNGVPLVRNVPDYVAYLTPAELPTGREARQALIIRLADILEVGPADIEAQLEKGRNRPTEPAVIGEYLSHEQAVLVSIESGSNPAVGLQVGTRREYLATEEAGSMSHVLGYLGRVEESDLGDADSTNDYQATDFIGRTGIEKTYEAELRGRYGRLTYEIDALGRKKEVITEERGQDGQNLVLAIDLELQAAAERSLEAELRATGRQRGSVVVLDPTNGDILALVSKPDYDNNLFARGIQPEEYASLVADENRPLFPRAVGASLPSGSTFKPVVAAAALEEGLITPSTTVFSTGGIRVDKWFFPDWKAGGHGPTDVRRALAESVNTFFYAIGGGWDKIEGLGVDRITAYAKKFGFGSRLGTDIWNESPGFLPTKSWKEKTKGEAWYIGDTYHLAIGQGDILVTPLQIAAMTGIVANGGELLRPRLVVAAGAGNNEPTPIPPTILNPAVVSAANLAVVRQGMRQAVTTGSARSLGDLPVAVAAKTGTAQWSSTRPTHAWFTSFAPYVNPKIVVTVSIEEGGEGSVTAAPVAKRILAWYFGRH